MRALASDTAKREPVEPPLFGLMAINSLFLRYAFFLPKVQDGTDVIFGIGISLKFLLHLLLIDIVVVIFLLPREKDQVPS
jgi:hypothetical protein